jgi:hypothetical protein
VTVQYTEAVNIEFGPFTEFVTGIKTDWDPTFGQRAAFSLAFQGVLENGTMIAAVIVPTTAQLTNLTWTSCRYACVSDSAEMSGHAVNLTVTVAPKSLAGLEYDIGSIYTTYDGPLDTAYLPVVVSLFAFVLASFVVLTRELSKLPSAESSATAGVQ